MKNYLSSSMKIALSFLLCLTGIIFSGYVSAAVTLNQKVDVNWALQDGQTGKTFKLNDLAGKVVILEWFNDGCPFVKKHYESNNMQQLQDKAKKLGFVWLSVNSSAKGKQGNLADTAAVKNIVSQWKINSSYMVLDHDGKLGKYFGAKVTPHLFILNEKSEVVYMGGVDSIKSADKNDVNSPKVEKFVDLAMDALAQKKAVTKAVTSEYGCGVKYAD